jgi:hypothetical protein
VRSSNAPAQEDNDDAVILFGATTNKAKCTLKKNKDKPRVPYAEAWKAGPTVDIRKDVTEDIVPTTRRNDGTNGLDLSTAEGNRRKFLVGSTQADTVLVASRARSKFDGVYPGAGTKLNARAIRAATGAAFFRVLDPIQLRHCGPQAGLLVAGMDAFSAIGTAQPAKVSAGETIFVNIGTKALAEGITLQTVAASLRHSLQHGGLPNAVEGAVATFAVLWRAIATANRAPAPPATSPLQRGSTAAAAKPSPSHKTPPPPERPPPAVTKKHWFATKSTATPPGAATATAAPAAMTTPGGGALVPAPGKSTATPPAAPTATGVPTATAALAGGTPGVTTGVSKDAGAAAAAGDARGTSIVPDGASRQSRRPRAARPQPTQPMPRGGGRRPSGIATALLHADGKAAYKLNAAVHGRHVDVREGNIWVPATITKVHADNGVVASYTVKWTDNDPNQRLLRAEHVQMLPPADAKVYAPADDHHTPRTARNSRKRRKR